MFFDIHAKTALPLDVYEFNFTNITNQEKIPLSQFKGKVILIVNTASKCGFTKQYNGLEKLYKEYKDKGLVIIGVPSNDFGGQEPGEDTEIVEFCKINYGVSFTMTHKEIVSGKNAHPFYLWAKEKLGYLKAPKWNFHKYLINKEGVLIDYFSSVTTPDNTKFINAIKKSLAEKIS